jgi:hypothetical protein
VPLRFFLAGPLFGLLAAAAIAWGGADAFGSRWAPSILAATHLVTLGFLTMVMSGALLQVLPVIVGAAVPMPRLTAAAVHLPLAAVAVWAAGGLLPDCAQAPVYGLVLGILPDPWMQRQARLHLLAPALLLGAAIWPQALVYPAAVACAAFPAFLWRNIAHVYRVHHRFVQTLHDALPAQTGAAQCQ